MTKATDGIGITTHGFARNIASQWASGGDALQVFASTGAITDKTLPLINECLYTTITHNGYTAADTGDLCELANYVMVTGERGPVDGWAGYWEETRL